MCMPLGKRYKQCCVALIALSLSSLAQANIYTSVVTPHTRIVAGDLAKNEFYILGQGESPPVKSSRAKTTHHLVKLNKKPAKPTKLAAQQKRVTKVGKKKAVLASKAKAKSVRHVASKKAASSKQHPVRVASRKPSFKQVDQAGKPNIIWQRQEQIAEDDRL